MGKKVREELKKLQSMKASVEAEIDALKVKQKNLQQEISLKKSNLNTLNQKINIFSKNNAEITVSEHAILRYIERVMGCDIESITEKILPPEVQETVDTLGNGRYPINNGEFRILIKDRVVVTVYCDEEQDI